MDPTLAKNGALAAAAVEAPLRRPVGEIIRDTLASEMHVRFDLADGRQASAAVIADLKAAVRSPLADTLFSRQRASADVALYFASRQGPFAALALDFLSPERAMVTALYCSAPQRRFGYAAALFREALNICARRGCTALSIPSTERIERLVRKAIAGGWSSCSLEVQDSPEGRKALDEAVRCEEILGSKSLGRGYDFSSCPAALERYRRIDDEKRLRLRASAGIMVELGAGDLSVARYLAQKHPDHFVVAIEHCAELAAALRAREEMGELIVPLGMLHAPAAMVPALPNAAVVLGDYNDFRDPAVVGKARDVFFVLPSHHILMTSMCVTQLTATAMTLLAPGGRFRIYTELPGRTDFGNAVFECMLDRLAEHDQVRRLQVSGVPFDRPEKIPPVLKASSLCRIFRDPKLYAADDSDLTGKMNSERLIGYDSQNPPRYLSAITVTKRD